jgi:3'(2'), 5'-bisphosphate nucleotidase
MLTSMEELLQSVRAHAHEAAVLVMAGYGSTAFTEKADKSPVTETDRRIHDLLEAALLPTGIPVLSEEGVAVSHPYPPRLWIIDPIDGTSGFINGTGDFAVMVGLLENGRPVLGVVHVPATGTQYFATKGGGAYMEKGGVVTELRVSDRHTPNLRAVHSARHPAPYTEGIAAALEVTETIRVGGIGVKASIIAEGAGDYFLTLGRLGEWDTCAPEIIVTEAGGCVTDRDGDPIGYDMNDSRITNGAVFTNGACHREVLTALNLTLRHVAL